MGIVAVLFGGLVATFTTLIALFGIGVDWSTGFTIYFATGAIVTVSVLTVGLLSRQKMPLTVPA